MNTLDKILLELVDKYQNEDVVLDRYDQEYAFSPEDLLIQRESRREAVELIKFAIKYLPEEDKRIIKMYVVERKTLKQIGEILGYGTTTIFVKLQKIPNKMKKLYYKHEINREFNTINMKESLQTFEELRDLLFFKTPKVHLESTCMGFPFEVMMKQWKWTALYVQKSGLNAGIGIWKTISQCLIPEYLAQAFSTQKGEVVCTLCSKCTRRDINT